MIGLLCEFYSGDMDAFHSAILPFYSWLDVEEFIEKTLVDSSPEKMEELYPSWFSGSLDLYPYDIFSLGESCHNWDSKIKYARLHRLIGVYGEHGYSPWVDLEYNRKLAE